MRAAAGANFVQYCTVYCTLILFGKQWRRMPVARCHGVMRPAALLWARGGEAKKVGTEQGPVSWFNYHKKPKTCEDVEAKCNEQCNKDNQCTTCCVNCPDNPMEKCFVKPVACTIHSDG